MKRTLGLIAAAAAIILSVAMPARADEGMWTFDNLPVKELKTKYNFTPSQEWLDNVRLSSVRFNDGGSGSFISPTGLVLTNHHVAAGQLQKMSSDKKDYLKDGFYADTTDKEVKCADLELNVLSDLKNVTDRVNASFKGLTGEAAVKARKAEIAKIEKESLDKTGMRSDVVTLYQGGEYWLYIYKKYRDIRLVMAPEKQVAFFGGDSDNFTYPRYDLDFAIFRVYENDKPLAQNPYMRYNPAGAKAGELVFVSGHPGTTKRSLTYAQYLFNRNYIYPTSLEKNRRTIAAIDQYAKRGHEEARRAATLKFYLENSIKAFTWEYEGLKDKAFSSEFESKEKNLRTKINENADLKKEVGSSFENIDKAYTMLSKRFNEVTYRNLASGRYDNNLANIAESIVTYAGEITKPDKDRLEGYHDSQLDTWKFGILSPAPIYKDMEEYLLSLYLTMAQEKIDANNPALKIMLGGKTPSQRASELISATKLNDPTYRKQLIDGGMDAVKKSEDPLIKMYLALDPYKRELIKWQESELEPLITPSSEKIARAKFKIYGKTVYPDATFTLRLNHGTVKGYEYNGTMAPPHTTFYGMYDRYYSFGGQQDWSLPQKYLDGEKNIKLDTPLNFVTDNDITGGNSGSPVINSKGEIVGLVFDGNVESLPGRFIYSPRVNRTVAVHTAGIIEVLRNMYNAGKLADEITK